MKFSDLLTGVLSDPARARVCGYGYSLPPMPGQRYGAGPVPDAARRCFVGFGAHLAGRRGATARRHAAGRARDGRAIASWSAISLLVLVLIIVYVLLVERIGFIPLSLALLMILFWRLGVPLVKDAVIAVLATAVHPDRLRRHPSRAAAARPARPRAVVSAWMFCIAALKLVADPYVLFLILAASLFGLFVGAIPGLTAAMAIALLVPVTFFMPPVPALAVIVTASAMAIFAGDIPGALLRIPERRPRRPTRMKPMR